MQICALIFKNGKWVICAVLKRKAQNNIDRVLKLKTQITKGRK
jgi:hypothetical protein